MKEKVESKKEFDTNITCHICGGKNVKARINSYDFKRMDMFFVEFICNNCFVLFGTKSGKPMHRPSKNIDWNRVKELRGLGLSWTKIAPNVGTTPPTLLKHAREKGLLK